VLDLFKELVSVVSALETEGVEYALCGGLAMAIWSHPRATVDIDLLIEPESVEKVERIAESLGYTIKARPMSFASGTIQIRRFSKTDPDGGDVLMLDLLLVTEPLADVWEDRTRVEWDGGAMSVVSRQGLIKLKTFRSSGVDLDDIRQLQEAQ
jgi:hypothetical protein